MSEDIVPKGHFWRGVVDRHYCRNCGAHHDEHFHTDEASTCPVMTAERPPKAERTLDFGDYCLIEQKRFGAPNEMYLHKVIGRLVSNCWVDAPVGPIIKEIIHNEMTTVIACVCAGVRERDVLRFREEDCKRIDGTIYAKTALQELAEILEPSP